VRLIGMDLERFASFSDACTWPDHPQKRDTCIIERKLGTNVQQVPRDLLDGLPEADKDACIAVPTAGWADESFKVTRRQSVAYCVRVGNKCIFKPGQEVYTEG